jgi:DNA-binding MarR family transcriptional regulator
VLRERSRRVPVSKAEYEILAEFRYALRQFVAFSEAEAKVVGLSPRQHQALLAIRGFPGRDVVTVGELAERLHIRPNSAVGLVDRLAADGLWHASTRLATAAGCLCP